MTKSLERPLSATPNHQGKGTSELARTAGNKVLNRVAVERPTPSGEKRNSLTDQMRAGARGAAMGHLRRVRELYKREKGTELPMNADTVRLAYVSQKARLNDSRVTDEMTRSQMTNELMAQAIFFSPQVSDALKTATQRDSKAVLSQFNDLMGKIARSLPTKLAPGHKTAVIDALKLESHALNQQIGHSSEISGKDRQSGTDVLRNIMNGISCEIAPENAMRADPNLEVTIPDDTASDLAGIDMMVTRKDDGRTIVIDTKARGKYLSTIAKIEGKDRVDEAYAGAYYFTGIHENGYPHFLMNANAFSQIPADGFDYTPAGQEKVRRTVHQMLDQ